jgi:hypothetical protein
VQTDMQIDIDIDMDMDIDIGVKSVYVLYGTRLDSCRLAT